MLGFRVEGGHPSPVKGKKECVCGNFTSSLAAHLIILCIYPACPLVNGALLVDKGGALPQIFVHPTCRPGENPKPQALQGSTGFVVGDVRLLSHLSPSGRCLVQDVRILV